MAETPHSTAGETALLSRDEGRVRVLTLHGPSCRNAIGPDVYSALETALIEADQDAGIGAVVVTGSGGYFCAGGNIAGLKESASAPHADNVTRMNRLNALIRAFGACGKPIVAGVEGGAAGAGWGLAAAADMIVASREAKFTAAYVKIGLTPDAGLSHALARVLPRPLAMELCLTGNPISAERLHALGAVNALAEPGTAEAEATSLATRLANGPAQSMAAIKSLLVAAEDQPLGAHLEAEALSMNRARKGREGAEGLASFLEKRKPDWSTTRD